jgi:hypothetical protein
MADERDPQVSARYRELGAEEPPEALDQAILAASRRHRAKRQRWYFGLAAAAVLLLAVTVTVQMEPGPDPEAVVANPAPAPMRERAESQSRASGEAKAFARPAETPEQWLERIAQLRKEGRNEEADRQLAELRKRYPDYPIPDKK